MPLSQALVKRRPCKRSAVHSTKGTDLFRVPSKLFAWIVLAGKAPCGVLIYQGHDLLKKSSDIFFLIPI